MIKNNRTLKLLLYCVLFIILPVLLLSSTAKNVITVTNGIPIALNHVDLDANGLRIALETADPNIDTLAADPENMLLLKIRVRDKHGKNIEGARIKLDVTGSRNTDSLQSEKSYNTGIPSENYGRVMAKSGVTSAGGTFYTTYSPPVTQDNGISNITITAHLEGSVKSSSLSLRLIPVPVVLIHGYQATHEIFSGMARFLQLQGFAIINMDYNSSTGVAVAAEELSKYLVIKEAELASSGIQTSRFDLIAHSMGGLVARYYTSSNNYPNKGNVRKLIFISVPQRGSHFAALGQQYFNDTSVKDMSVGSELFTSVYPGMINAGLNPSIQTAAILGRYDEVVNTSSADLTVWGIETEIFEVGENNMTIEKLLNGEVLNADNHKLILYNGKVFNRILEMLKTDLQFPSTK